MENEVHYITIAVKINEGTDIQEIGAEMDYDLVHKDIVATEIVHISTEHPGG